MNQQNKPVYDPINDGVDHIWLSPKGRTALGQKLFIGAHRRFLDPTHGWFSSIMAFWLWFDSGRVEGLRDIHHENMLRSSMFGLKDTPGNRTEVCRVLRASILNDPQLCDLLRTSTLPFAAYEVVKYPLRNEDVIYPLLDREWYVNALEDIRIFLKNQRIGG
mgnify:CR=1 FL=1